MRNNTRNLHVRFNLDRTEQNRAWRYMVDHCKRSGISYNQFISQAILESGEKENRQSCPLRPEECDLVNRCVSRIMAEVETTLRRFLTAYVNTLPYPNGQINQKGEEKPNDAAMTDEDIDWDYLGG